LWFDAPHRPTRDADFLGFGAVDAATLAATIGLSKKGRIASRPTDSLITTHFYFCITHLPSTI
ncbi:MAG: hypothetical protein ABI580_07280, partial [Burkholderiaceae bacterium]